MNEAYGQQIENEPRQVWGEDSQSGCSDLSTGETGTTPDSSKVSGEPERIYRKVGTRGILDPAVLGGILSLERKKAEEALRNAEECIQWYTREKDRALEWISEIDALQAQLNINDETKAEADAEVQAEVE
ncbi:hypothetical protein [Microseira wollei]|nr:hypothetical protein [Microseira wollei]